MHFYSDYRITKSDILNVILTIMLWINFLITFFPANNGSILWKFIPNEDSYTGIWLRLVTIFNFGSLLLIILCKLKFGRSVILYFCFFLWVFYLISRFYNVAAGDYISIIVIPIEYLGIYIILRYCSISGTSIKYILLFSGLWISIPILMFLFGSIQTKLSFMSIGNGRVSTYGGFALHRNYFGYYAGLVILLFIFCDTKKILKFAVIILGIIAIFISASRSSFVCLFGAIAVYVWKSQKKWRFPLLVSMITLCILYYILATQIQVRTGDIMYTSDREDLFQAFSDTIRTHPILGKGSFTRYYSESYPQGAQAHNFVLQVWSDYGIITLLFFCLFWGAIFYFGDLKVKSFIVYLVLFGLFQPYFILGMPSHFLCMDILFTTLSGGHIHENSGLRRLDSCLCRK